MNKYDKIIFDFDDTIWSRNPEDIDCSIYNVKFIKEHLSVFNAIIFFGSIFNTKYEILVERYSKSLENNATLADFFISAMIADGLESAKNLSIITVDDFDTWDIFIAILFWISMYAKAVDKEIKKQEAKQITAPS